MEPTPTQKRLLRNLGTAHARYLDAFEAYNTAFEKACFGGCRQTHIAIELGVTPQAISQAIKRWRGGPPKPNDAQGRLFA